MINGFVMSRDNILAEVNDNKLNIVNDTLLPFYLKRTGDITGWLERRAIDTHRVNSRLLKRALRLGTLDDTELVLSVNGATITDTYWIKSTDSNLTYNEIRFKNNMFDKLALSGDPDSFNLPYSRTPELTNTGSFEKCWRLINGDWWIYKAGSPLEIFSEMFIYLLGREMGFDMAHYEIVDTHTVRSLDFTRKTAIKCVVDYDNASKTQADGNRFNYESAEGLMGDDEDYIKNHTLFCHFSKEIGEQYRQMIYLDTLCFNMDRHTQNYGVLRDVDTGKVLRLAPNYDNNIALFSRGVPRDLSREKDKLIELYKDFSNAVYTVKEEMVDSCFKKLNIMEFNRYKEDIVRFIMNGNKRLIGVRIWEPPKR
jgi:hypothetical protein